ncbi:MAG: hypothetical protein GX640_05240, partial [Fibrobacter sp.]|nr:hypothetical protein [Fibrobacter sp.]
SWCTGWDFNDNHYFYSKTLAGPWTAGGNIAVSNTHTYDSQVGYAVTVKGSTATTYLYTGDRWCVNNYGMSRIVLLPIEVAGTKLKVNWNDQWNINVSTGEWAPGAKSFIDGVYTITAKHSGMVFGTSGASVQQQTYTGAETQLWRIQNIGASHFKISSVASGRVMDISGGSREAGAKLLQYDWNDGYNQKWQIIDCGNGYHRLVNVNTLGKSLEVANSSNLAGTDVVLGSFGYKDNQLLRLTAVKKDVESKKTYMILNRGSGKALDAGSQTADAAITQQSATGTASQVWKVVDLFNGYYTISTNANIALDNSESVRNLDAITCNILDGSYSQQWQIVPVETGYYKLINRLSGKAVDNKDGLSDDGNPVIQYTDYASNNTNQQWKFVPAEFVGSKYRSPQCQSSVNGPNDKKYFFDLRGRAISLKYSSVNKKVTEAPGFHGVCIVRQRDKLQRMVIVE